MFSNKNGKPGQSTNTKQSILSSTSKHRAGKSSTSRSRRSFKEQAVLSEKVKKLPDLESQQALTDSTTSSPVITISVGINNRLFACHESVISVSPYFASICRSHLCDVAAKRITLVDEIPEVFSSILEFLYKGDYYPRLVHDKRRNSWTLENSQPTDDNRVAASTILDPRINQIILKDTALYCAADKYGLEELKRLALRKQGLQSRIQCSIILASARFAYDNTPESDAKLRAHYLALIIRSRHTFKRSGTLQSQMEVGGKMFFDLFVAMCNHMDDISSVTKSPR